MARAEADPLRAASRWRPRPARLRCLRPSGAGEVYAVADGRRAWSSLRKLVPADAVELVGEDSSGAVVGRWASSSAAAAIAAAGAAAAVPELDDEPPSEEAANFRWLLRETRSLFVDQLRAGREALAVVTDALRIQRDTFAALAGAGGRGAARPAVEEDDDEDPGFQQISALLAQALRLVQAERTVEPASSPASTSTITPPRESP